MFDKSIYIFIAITYNLFAHAMASMLYKNIPYEEKHHNTIMFLVVAGIVAIVIAKIHLKKDNKDKDKDKDDKKEKSVAHISKGLTVGGILLLITAAFANWENLTDSFKLIVSGACLLFFIWVSYKIKNRKK
uniref:Uncharacterized protein n=1 Tax=Mimivirus LCMiAC01 TaxID=2506608 RepID=A0A481YZ63_9VIRU|nr:MAG: hypothetical protein LCMiAC01_02190 [Mimivirus LCMiAC01]